MKLWIVMILTIELQTNNKEVYNKTKLAMKHLSILLFLAIFTFNCSKKLSDRNKTIYYFCSSLPKDFKKSTQVNYLLYTDILKTNLAQQDMPQKTNEWHLFVSKKCNSNSGCTADLYYYFSEEEANSNRNKLLELCSDVEKYKLQKVKFK